VYGDNSSNPLVGFVKQVLVYSDVLSSSEITTLYNSGTPVTSPSTASLVSKYDLTSNANDSQGSNNGTLNPMKLGTGAYSFNGSTDKITTTVQIPQTTDHTVTWWQKVNSTLATDTTYQFVMRATGSGGNYYAILFRDNYLKCMKGDGTQTQLSAQSNFAVGDWHHCALVRNDTTDDVTFYLDGSATTVTDGMTEVDTSANLWIGSNNGSEGTPVTLDDMSIWARSLTATEISDLVSGQTGYLQQAQGNIGFRGNGKLNYKILRKNSNESISYDIGTNLNATTWTCRLKLKNTSLDNTESGANLGFWGISDKDSAVASDGSQDWIGFLSRCSNSEAEYFGHSVNDSTLGEAGTQMGANDIITSNLTTEWGWEIKRTGETTAVVTLYPNWNFTGTPTATVNLTVSSSYSALRYFVIRNFKNSTAKTTNLNGYVEEIKIWNGTNDTTTTPLYTSSFSTTDTSQLVSSLTNKSELKAYYSMDSDTATQLFEVTGSNGTGWTSSGTSINFNSAHSNAIGSTSTSSGNYVIRSVSDLTGGSTTYFDNDKWVMDFEFYHTGTSNNLYIEAGSDNPSYSGSYYGIAFNMQDNGVDWYGILSNNNNGTRTELANQANFAENKKGTNMYGRLIRDGTTVTCRLWNTDSTRSGNGDFSPSQTINSAITNLDKLSIWANGSGGNYYFKNIKVYNGVTDPSQCKNDFSSTSDLEALTGVRTNSIFQQTDDTPTYWWYNGTSWVLSGDFNPNAISDLKYWLNEKCLSSYSDGDTITSVTSQDDSSTATTVANTPTVTTVNSLKAFKFLKASSEKITANTNFSDSEWTIFAVAKYDSGSGNGRVISTNSSSYNWLVGWHGNYVDRAFVNGWINQPTTTSQDLIEYSLTSKSGDTKFYREKTLLASGTTTTTVNGIVIGGDYHTDEFADCTVCELIYYGKILSDSERELVSEYLINKWGVVV